MSSLVDAITERLGARRVALVRLEIGALAGVAHDALLFCFEACTRGTPLDGAKLDILGIPARARCRACGGEDATDSFAAPCTCGSFDRELLCGDELRLKEVEVL